MLRKPEPQPDIEFAGLIAAIATDQDRSAFARLFGHYAPRVKALLMRTGAPAGVAEEMAQETLLTVWRKASYFDPGRASVGAWIFTIARNIRIDDVRRERRAQPAAYYETLDPVEPERPDAAFAATEREHKVRAALKDLPDEQARVVELSFFEGKAHGEIARALDMPLGTVKSRMRLALGRLRKVLEDLI